MSTGTGLTPVKATAELSAPTLKEFVTSQLKRANVYGIVPTRVEGIDFQSSHFYTREELKEPALYLFDVYSHYHHKGLVMIIADEEYTDTFIGGTCHSGVYEGTDEPFYVIHCSVHGPFPCNTIHEGQPVRLESQGEALVWLVMHEFCHFLKRSGQIDGPNDEASAIRFADEHLEAFRSLSSV